MTAEANGWDGEYCDNCGKYFERIGLCEECRIEVNERIKRAAQDLFDNRLGWSDNRNPCAPRELWANLSVALYGENDLRTKDLITPLETTND